MALSILARVPICFLKFPLWTKCTSSSGVVNAVCGNRFSARNISFLNKLPAEKLWKSVTSVSNVGRQKGRGKGKRSKDLHRGQILGKGKRNYVWPGLNSPIKDESQRTVSIKELPEDTAYLENITKERNKLKFGVRRLKLNPLDRGFSGSSWPGRKIGPPEPLGNETFEGFETIVLEFRTLVLTTGNLGKKRKQSAFVVTGNQNGTIGFGKAQALNGKVALRKAKAKASKSLITFPLYNNRTIYHNLFSKFNSTKLYMKKAAEGDGLTGQRVVKAVCQMLGIKDLYAKIEGSTNVKNICKALVAGLENQRTHQEIADETGLYIVEQDPDRDGYPVVVGVPSKPREHLSKTEKIQVMMTEKFLGGGEYFGDGKIQYINPKVPWFYDSPEYRQKAWEWHIHRNKYDCQIRLYASDTEWDKKFIPSDFRKADIKWD